MLVILVEKVDLCDLNFGVALTATYCCEFSHISMLNMAIVVLLPNSNLHICDLKLKIDKKLLVSILIQKKKAFTITMSGNKRKNAVLKERKNAKKQKATVCISIFQLDGMNHNTSSLIIF